MPHVLEARRVVKRFTEGKETVEVLKGFLSGRARRGRHPRGPFGLGKTTFLSILGCILTPTAGEVSVDGEAVDPRTPARLPEIRKKSIGFVFQQFNLFPALTALENVEYALNVKGLRGRPPGPRRSAFSTRSGSPIAGGSFPGTSRAARSSASRSPGRSRAPRRCSSRRADRQPRLAGRAPDLGALSRPREEGEPGARRRHPRSQRPLDRRPRRHDPGRRPSRLGVPREEAARRRRSRRHFRRRLAAAAVLFTAGPRTAPLRLRCRRRGLSPSPPLRRGTSRPRGVSSPTRAPRSSSHRLRRHGPPSPREGARRREEGRTPRGDRRRGASGSARRSGGADRRGLADVKLFESELSRADQLLASKVGARRRSTRRHATSRRPAPARDGRRRGARLSPRSRSPGSSRRSEAPSSPARRGRRDDRPRRADRHRRRPRPAPRRGGGGRGGRLARCARRGGLDPGGGRGGPGAPGRVEEIPDAVTERRTKPQDPGRPSDTRVLLVKIRFDDAAAGRALKLGRRVELQMEAVN